MTYFNPKVYNYSNLNDEDQGKVAGMYEMIENFRKYFYVDPFVENDMPTLQKVVQDITGYAIDHAVYYMNMYLKEYIVACIEQYDHDVDEVDTNNYLHGLSDWNNV